MTYTVHKNPLVALDVECVNIQNRKIFITKSIIEVVYCVYTVAL